MNNLTIYGCINPTDTRILEVHNVIADENDITKSFFFFVAEHLQNNYKINIEKQLFNFLEKRETEEQGTFVIENTGNVYKIEYEYNPQASYVNVYEKIVNQGYIYNTSKTHKIRTFFLKRNELENDFTEIEVVSDKPPYHSITIQSEKQCKETGLTVVPVVPVVPVALEKPIENVDGFMEELTEKLKTVRIKNDIDLHITGFATRKRKRRKRYD